MKKLILLFLFCFVTLLQINGQGFDYTRDYKTIVKATTNPTSRLFYDSLKNRFTRDSKLLNTAELVALQIGYTQRPEYNPYGDVDLDRTFIRAASWTETDTTVMYGNQYLSKNPVSLSATYALWKVYETRQNVALAKKYEASFQALINALLSTGNGSTTKPYFVVGPIDGQILIRQYWNATIGPMGSGRDKQKNFLDMLTKVDPDGKTESLNFIIQHAIGRM